MLSEYFTMRITNSPLTSLGCIFNDLELRFDLLPGTGLKLYKNLAYWKQIVFDVDKEIDFSDLTQKSVFRFCEVCV